MIALGIDNFKYVSESLGVAAGDEVLAGLERADPRPDAKDG